MCKSGCCVIASFPRKHAPSVGIGSGSDTDSAAFRAVVNIGLFESVGGFLGYQSLTL